MGQSLWKDRAGEASRSRVCGTLDEHDVSRKDYDSAKRVAR